MENNLYSEFDVWKFYFLFHRFERYLSVPAALNVAKEECGANKQFTKPCKRCVMFVRAGIVDRYNRF